MTTLGSMSLAQRVAFNEAWYYSTGAGLTGIGPDGVRPAAALSKRGLSAPMVRSVSDTQPGGASTVGPLPGPGTMCTTR